MKADGNSCPDFISENSYASGQKKRPRGPRSYVSNTVHESGSLVRQPTFDLETRAVTYYRNCHLDSPFEVHDISKNIMDDTLQMWKSKADSPVMKLAISSIALAVFSRTQQHPPAALKASKRYQEVLQLAQSTMASMVDSNVETYLIAVCVMGRYEDAIHCAPRNVSRETRFTDTLQSISHHDGAMAILKIWRKQLSHNQPATDIIKHTRRGCIKSAIMRNHALPDWLQDGSVFGERGLELDFDRIVVQIADIRQVLNAVHHRESTFLRRTPHNLRTIGEALNEDARKIDEALQEWRRKFPSSWSYQRHNLPLSHAFPTADFFSPMVYSFSCVADVGVWIQYFIMRMLVDSARLKILRLRSSKLNEFTGDAEQTERLSHLSSMAESLASSIPFCLQRFKVIDGSEGPSSETATIALTSNEASSPYVLAALMVWPLTIASSLAYVDARLKSWFRSELARQGRMLGFRVLECAETESWLQL